MNSPSPLVPQGSNLEQQNRARSSLRVKIFCALGINVMVLLVLLMQGCKREQPPVETTVTEVPAVYDESNMPPVTIDYATESNEVLPIVESPTTTPTPGMTVQPITEPVTTMLPTTTGTEYKIQAGDTYSSIAPKFGVTVKALQEANPNVNPTRLQINQTITIPPPSASSTPAPPVINAGTGETLYTVKSGDTLSRIAVQFGTTINAIKTANGLSTDRIKVGDKLKIPAKTK